MVMVNETTTQLHMGNKQWSPMWKSCVLSVHQPSRPTLPPPSTDSVDPYNTSSDVLLCSCHNSDGHQRLPNSKRKDDLWAQYLQEYGISIFIIIFADLLYYVYIFHLHLK